MFQTEETQDQSVSRPDEVRICSSGNIIYVNLTVLKQRTLELLAKLPQVMESLVRLWGPPTTLLSKLKAPRSLALDFSKDETHNRFAIQDQIVHILEPLFAAFPTRFVMAILQIWRFSPSGAVQQGTSQAPTEFSQTVRSSFQVAKTAHSLNSANLFNIL